jgi:Ca2+-binding EF-hand superfamily protein
MSNMEVSAKENVEEIYEAIFVNFDKNGNGTIEKNDVLPIFKELVA